MKPRLPIDTIPGDLCDRNGVPIYPGDLLKTYNFTGPRRRKWFMYHVVTQDVSGVLHATPTAWMAKTERQRQLSGGQCYLHSLADEGGVIRDTEVIDGYGPDGIVCYTDRKRVKVQPVTTTPTE